MSRFSECIPVTTEMMQYLVNDLCGKDYCGDYQEYQKIPEATHVCEYCGCKVEPDAIHCITCGAPVTKKKKRTYHVEILKTSSMQRAKDFVQKTVDYLVAAVSMVAMCAFLLLASYMFYWGIPKFIIGYIVH